MEFKTKAAVAHWANDQTMAEIAAYYDGLPGVKAVKKFESREVAVTRIWAALGPGVRRPKAAGKKATSGRKKPKPRKASNTVRDEVVKLMSRAGGATLTELMKARQGPGGGRNPNVGCSDFSGSRFSTRKTQRA